MITTYEQNFTVHRYECDMHSRMLPASLLRRAQQISTDHCDDNGLTAEIYEKTNTAFLLAKQKLKIKKPVMYGMNITIKTEAFAPQRAVYCRTIRFYNGEELLAEADSRWILIDTSSKRIMRRPPAEIESFFSLTMPECESFGIEKCATEPVAHLKALYSMCDLNRHINNTVYADLVCDYIAPELLEAESFEKLILTYHNEVPYLADFVLQRGKTASGGYYFCGAGEQNSYFEANVYMKKAE